MQTQFKGALARHETAMGAWVSLTDPASMEIMSQAGFDFLLIDAEHAPLSDETLRDLLMAAKGSSSAVIVRVPWNDAVRIKMVLDLGAAGIMVPMVNSAAEARHAVAACKYPPEGIRSVGPWRASGYYADQWGYVMRANAAVVVIVQCEHIRAVEALPEIVRVPGIDAIFIGPADLTASLHRLPDTNHPETRAAIDRIAATCRSAGVTCGIDADVAGVPHYFDMGIRLFTIATDTGFLLSGAAAAVAFRATFAG